MNIQTIGREQAAQQKLLNRSDLKRLGIRVSNASLLRWEQRGRFPRRVRMAGTTVAWLKSEVDAWIEARAEERSRHVYADAN